MVFSQSNYRHYLKEVLVQRKSLNPSYSLRAFARDLGLTPSHLSELSRGKANPSPEMAVQISNRLGLNKDESEYFSLLVQYESAKIPEVKFPILKRLQKLQPRVTASKITDLNIDLFQMIADWYHIPILEMTELDHFVLTEETASKRLKISKIEADVAIQRLVRLNLLKAGSNGGFVKVHSEYHFKSKIPNGALRSFHRQMLEKTIESLSTQTPDEKYIGSQTFSIDVNQLDEARMIIDECRQKLVKLFNSGKNKTEVYHGGFQLFRVSQSANSNCETNRKVKS